MANCVRRGGRGGRRGYLITGKTSRRQGTAPTISDVARRAGVSLMTVSRVINAEQGVRPATRALVNTAIADLHYAPNPAARSLASAERSRVGLLYSNPAAGFVGEFLLGSVDEATRCNVQLIFEKVEAGEREVDVAARLIADGIAGVVLTPPLCELPSVIDLFAAAAIPTVLLATECCAPGRLSVAIDDRRAAQAMTRHLIALGHRRIGFITGNPNLSASSRRLDGYRDTLHDAGLGIDDPLIVHGLFTYRSGLDAAERLLCIDDRPTAIFASNDDMAAATIAMAHRHALDVPGDLTVVGFDDTALATTIWPELTTIRQPIADMTRLAINKVVRAIRGGQRADPVPVEYVDYALIRRQSDAAVAPRSTPD